MREQKVNKQRRPSLMYFYFGFVEIKYFLWYFIAWTMTTFYIKYINGIKLCRFHVINVVSGPLFKGGGLEDKTMTKFFLLEVLKDTKF